MKRTVTRDKVDRNAERGLTNAARAHMEALICELQNGESPTRLNGKKLMRTGRHWEFRVGRNHRLLAEIRDEDIDITLLTRQHLEKYVKRIHM